VSIRLSWTQPEDLVPHAFVVAAEDGVDATDLTERWLDAGGAVEPPVSGASTTPAAPGLRRLGRAVLDELDLRPVPPELLEREPDALDAVLARATDVPPLPALPAPATLRDRVRGAWLGRAAGCLLGKPVEKIPRQGIRAIAASTGNWPVRGYFTAVGLDPEVARTYPWNRRSRTTSLLENIDGMPEDDDLNFPLVALRLLERVGPDLTTDDVAQAWLADLPGGRVFTAERITYRNLLDGDEPDVAADVRNPFRSWIGAQIRSDVYGWANPGSPRAAAGPAWQDGRLSHRRTGLYGATFVAAACSAALVADTVDDVVAAGLSVVPAESRYAEAVRFGADVARSTGDDETGLDVLHERYGHLHWVHALNNTALLAFALVRSGGDLDRAVPLAVTGGWDTDSVGATAGSICGALAGASSLDPRWTAPLHGRLASSLPGFDGVLFDDLADRTLALQGATR